MLTYPYTREDRLARACRRAAMLIRGVWEETGLSDTRFLDAMIFTDSLTIVGVSVEAREDTMCREHVVPRILIIRECLRMLADGMSDGDLAELIRANNKIVFVSSDERLRLDGQKHSNLRERMPSGWCFGDNVFARLEAAGIEWYPYSRTHRYPW